MKDEALKLALEALDNSYDYVAEEADRVERMYGNYPTRQGKVKGLRQDERKHMEAITAIKQALAAPVQQSRSDVELVVTYGEIHESMQALLRTGLQRDQQIYMVTKDKPLYTTPPNVATPLDETASLAAPVQQSRSDVEPVEFFDWYDNAHWGNEDFKEGCHRSWNAAIKYTTPPAAQRPVPEERND